MSKFYSKTTNGFYDSAINTTMPSDAVAVTDATYASLMAAQASGDTIGPDANGNPIATAPPAPTLAQVQASSLAALLANMNYFIANLPNGGIRYDQDFTNSVFIFALNKGIATAPIPALMAWQTAVRTFYFTTQAAIQACTTVAAVQAINISVAQFESLFGTAGTQSPDPGITTQQLSTS
jgi:hypothetical protein